MLPNHWFNSGVNGEGVGGNEDQEEICCPTIGLTVVLTERVWGEMRIKRRYAAQPFVNSGINGARGGGK
jgi:hypothetical protein